MIMAGTTTRYVFDLQPGDVFWCTADCGWYAPPWAPCQHEACWLCQSWPWRMQIALWSAGLLRSS